MRKSRIIKSEEEKMMDLLVRRENGEEKGVQKPPDSETSYSIMR